MSTLLLPNTDHQVSCQWLSAHLNTANLIILDASMDNPVNKPSNVASGVISGALRFDFSKHIVDVNAASPNMMPPPSVFQEKVRELGINQDSIIIVYDKQGLFSAARAWFMFKTMGFDNLAILQGGLPAWLAAGFALSDDYAMPNGDGNFTVLENRHLFVDKHTVLNKISDNDSQLVDARGYGRFSGQEDEPREGMRSGHIPNALNLHYASLIENGQLLDKARLSEIFNELVPAPNEFIFSCGSGVTACILALAADIVGYKYGKVYDGSWSEWGKDVLLPIDTVAQGAVDCSK